MSIRIRSAWALLPFILSACGGSSTPELTTRPGATLSPTITPSVTPTVTPQETPTPTVSPTPGPSSEPSATPTPTATPTLTPTVTATPTVSPSPAPGNRAPRAAAIAPATVVSGAEVVLDGRDSRDPDGDDLQFAWTQSSGPTVSLINADTATAGFTAPSIFTGQLTLSFSLIVSDPDGLSDSASVTVVVIPPPPVSEDCVESAFCVGAAKRSITPSQAHIDGIEEPRFFGAASHLQRFNLGGFGIDPLQNFPDPVGGFGDQLTQPAQVTAHQNAAGDHEETGLRAMLVSLPGAESVLFIGIDAVGAGNIIQDRVRQRVAAATGLSADNILFGQTHSHAGADLQGLWGGVPQDWIEHVLYPAAISAALEALVTARPARLHSAQGSAPQFNNYRRPRVDESAEADPTVTLLQATDLDSGNVIANLLQYNAHPTTLNEDPRAPHADYALGATDWLEGLGGVALYFNGPIADASPSGSRPDCSFPDDARYGVVRCRGEGIAEVAVGFIANGRELAPTLQVAHVEAVLPVTNPLFIAAGTLGSFNRYYDFLSLPLADIPFIGEPLAAQLTSLPQLTPTASTPVSRITLGGAESGLEIVTIPGETTNSFGQYIRGLAAPGAQVMLLGLTQNSFGYILPEDEFDYLDRPDRAGLFVPGTNYEEFVSLGPLTAPLLRLQAYNPLFGISAADPGNLPPLVTACFSDPADPACGLSVVGRRLDYYQRSYAEICRNSGAPENFCALLDPDTPLAGPCREAGLPKSLCAVLGEGEAGSPGSGGGVANLAVAALDSLLRGCDPLDPTACLYPFPSNHYTVAATDSPTLRTGRRLNFNPLAMPRNIAGKPIDPSEWNRNDGFSPGPMILTVVPGLDSLDALKLSYGLPTLAPDNLVGITHPALSLDPSSPIQLLEVDADGNVRPTLAWAELDVQANNYLLSANPFGLIPEPFPSTPIDRPAGVPVQTSLIIRPARNLTAGSRYVVVLRKLRNSSNQSIAAQPLFAACRDRQDTSLPPLQARCASLEDSVFPVLERAGIARDASLYLAWDFTVASTENTTARLVHMRDQAFADLSSNGADCSRHNEANTQCAPPDFEIDTDRSEGGFRVVEGTLTVPSFLVLPDASPQNDPQLASAISAITGLAAMIPGIGEALSPLLPVIGSASLPPNRLYYSPFDGGIPTDPALAAYGDGLPDRLGGIGSQNTRFICRIPEGAYDAAAPAYRPSLYGHGLLGGRGEVGAGNVNQFAAEHGMVFCAIDWFGFATGDVPNVATALVDMSNFAVIPDASQQGFINKMFMARLMQHPQGLVSHPAFRKVDGQGATVSVIDRREIFYDGNSQGGILSGPVLAVSKDLNRGVFGVPGMNYSTLLRRSVDFTPYSTPVYLSYPGELDRNLIFGLIQMLWDRSENNGYMTALADGSLDGQDNAVLLHPAYGDHQVSTWTSDVISRTLDAPTDRRRVLADRPFPDIDHAFELPELQYVNHRAQGSAQVYFLQPGVINPPIDENPPVAGSDPHGYPRAQRDGQCQKSHFLRHEGFVADTLGLNSVSACTARFGAVPTQAQPAGTAGPDPEPGAAGPDYGIGLTAATAQFFANLHGVTAAITDSDPATAGARLASALTGFGSDVVGSLGPDPQALLGISPTDFLAQETAVERRVEPVVLTGAQLPGWSVPAAAGLPAPYPSGTGLLAQCNSLFPAALCDGISPLLGPLAGPPDQNDAHNGIIVYPPPGTPAALLGMDPSRIAGYAWRDGAFVEIPLQVDQRFPHFLSNAASDFALYSGTDEELNYEWDVERWDNNDPNGCVANYVKGRRDPVPGFDDDDEVVFMATDAGAMAPIGARPDDPDLDPDERLKLVRLIDPLSPQTERVVYLGLKRVGATAAFYDREHYVSYQRDANADQWIDRSFFAVNDPEKLGTSNTGYGPNRSGIVCDASGARPSSDRFPRDGVTVSTDTYRWYASGRWMIREINIVDPDLPLIYGPDLIDRWKGRAFQQSPDSTISIVGFEDEQVNWEANSTLIGERIGPVRAIRAVWGADSGTNVTKTESFYRDGVGYRYRVRVHPIPADGLYTSWDYNRSAMVPAPGENVPGGRYYTLLRPQGVPIDGINDDVGQVDNLFPIFGQCLTLEGPATPDITGRCPAFFDAADPTFNLPLAFANWEQVSGKGRLGALVYTFELKGLTSLANPVVVPYYRDDACLDDGTGDDPVPRPFPGESYSWNGGAVPDAYDARAGRPLDHTGNTFADCLERQGAHGAHGIHYFVTHDSDNAFLLGKPLTEIDAEQWQFMVPMDAPRNIGAAYANVIRARLVPVVVPAP